MHEMRLAAAHQARHSVVHSPDHRPDPLLRLLTMAAMYFLVGCTAVLPPGPGTPVLAQAGEGPEVRLEIAAAGNVQPGDVVEIHVTTATSDTADAYRLAIEGADTGWRTHDELTEPGLRYSWIAGEPDTYEVVGQVRDRSGAVGEQRQQIVVMPYAAPEKTGSAGILTTKVSLPAYPLEEYQTPAMDRVFRWPYQVFDRERFLLEAPVPALREYDLLVLENDYLQVSILPELGGRIWQVIHKPSGDTMFYQNNVVKPSPWGPPQQGGWLGLGGIEWSLPVIEHGYDWGTAWEVSPFTREDGTVGVTIATPHDGRLISAEIAVTLPPNAAYFEIEPTIHNLAAHALSFDYWHTAMLAPGPGNRPSGDLHFVVPAKLMTVHSTGDTALPGPRKRFTWPTYYGRDMSRLGNWDHYLGFFEYPAAHGPFVGIYDPAFDAGAVRAFPSQVVRGSKVFGLGWRRPIGSESFTDDDSAYVELHAGLAPSFFDSYRLPADGLISWQERWYPVKGIGDMVYANRQAALNLAPVIGGLKIALYVPENITGTLVVDDAAAESTRRIPLSLGPETPYMAVLARVNFGPMLTVTLEDEIGQTLLIYRPE